MKPINIRIHDFQNVLAEGLDGLTSVVAELFSQEVGRREVADQGTLFLDEVGDIPIEIHPRLSRALQERNLNDWAVFPPCIARSLDIVRHL
jgi:hypothetical protein